MSYSIDDIEWREIEIANTVEFLNATNPHGYSAEDIKAHAFRQWEAGGFKSTFIGTAGWYVTIVRKSYEADVPFIALVSVMAYSAVKWLREQQA